MTHSVLACDPGASSGFAVLLDGELAYASSTLPPRDYDEAVFEAQHSAASVWRDGVRVRISRKSQSTLGFTAGRLFERVTATRKFRILPDDWRALLWPGSRRLPKKVVLARLEVAYGDLVLTRGKPRADVLEAVGIAHAWLRVPEGKKAKYEVRD